MMAKHRAGGSRSSTRVVNTAATAKKLRMLTQRYINSVEKLGAEIRVAVLVPLCEKYRLQFTSGMGTFGFSFLADSPLLFSDDRDLGPDRLRHIEYQVRGYSEDGDVSRETCDRVIAMKKDLNKVYELLNEDIGKFSLGDYVNDVTPRRK